MQLCRFLCPGDGCLAVGAPSVGIPSKRWEGIGLWNPSLSGRVTGLLFPPSLQDVLVKVVRYEGFFSLWKGFTPYYARLGPHTVLTFIFLEQMNKFYRKFFLSA